MRKLLLFAAVVLLCASAPAVAAPRLARGRRPTVVLLIHGGGWIEGTPQMLDPWIPGVRARIHARAVSIYYPMLNVAAAEQYATRAARRWTRAGYNVEALGISAGGTLADWLAARCLVHASASIGGPTDLVAWNYEWDAFVGLKTLGQQMRLSPFGHIRRRCAAPMFLAGGSVDPLVPHSQQTMMRDRLHQLGLAARYLPYGGGHLAPRWVYLRAIDWLGKQARLVTPVPRRVQHTAPTPMGTTEMLSVMVTAAREYWGEPVACANVRFVFTDTLPAGIPADSWAYVEPGDVPDCTISLLTSESWGDAGYLATHYPLYCRIVVHEFSHLLGMWDNPQPGTILSQDITTAVPAPECDNMRLPLKDQTVVFGNGTNPLGQIP